VTWICLVDDEPDVCDVLTEALRGAGYGVQSFQDGSDALEAIEKSLEAPRLVILDVLLRSLSGREVLRRLRAGRRVPKVPVLVITGMDVDENYFAPWPIAGILRKPIAVEVLLKAVAREMRPRRRRR
jgi:two-component system OmpR family response regulator